MLACHWQIAQSPYRLTTGRQMTRLVSLAFGRQIPGLVMDSHWRAAPSSCRCEQIPRLVMEGKWRWQAGSGRATAICRRLCTLRHFENDAGNAIGGSTRGICNDCKEVAGVVVN